MDWDSELPYNSVGGLHWYPELDVVSVPIPPLHFGKVKRGGLDTNLELFSGTFQDLTLRQVVSIVASVFDLRGLLAPVRGSMRLGTRKTCKLVLGWDDPMPEIMRNKWIRAMMPEDAAKSRARTTVKVNAALEILMM